MKRQVKKSFAVCTRKVAVGMLCAIMLSLCLVVVGCEKPDTPPINNGGGNNTISNGNGNDTIPPIENPCDCIMDTLKGEWSWIWTYGFGREAGNNTFKSVVKILSQNEDSSINYEVFVEDTLFYRGNFQYQYFDYELRGIRTNIILPHHSHEWAIYLGDVVGKPIGKNTLGFVYYGAVDVFLYHYEKIK